MNKNNFQQILDRLNDYERRIRVLEIGTQPAKKKVISGQTDTANPDDLILSIVNKVGDSDESEEIQSKVLDQRSMDAKILLCFYISYKYFKNEWLTSGSIEKITSDLGTKVDKGNASNKIKKEIRQYLESGTTRKKGQPTPYRLNRKGFKRFEEILHGKLGINSESNAGHN